MTCSGKDAGQEQRRQGHRVPPGWGLASCRNSEFIPQTLTTHTLWALWTSLCSQPLYLFAEGDSVGEECGSDHLILAKITGELPTRGQLVNTEISLL